MVSTSTDPAASTEGVAVPSVLAVLVVRDGLPWLRDCLRSLAAQTHPRFGVVAVDTGSTDGSREVLRQALGDDRVLLTEGESGLADAVRAAVDLPAAQAAEYLLIVHDDVVLAADVVARMLDVAVGIAGVERVGVVGPKVVDWDDPRILREVGWSTDRLGFPHSPLQEGELDQGQYDRVLEVLAVSDCTMLVSREAWQRVGLFDERFGSHGDDIDLCWRARLAGFRVLMTPLAQVRHRAAGRRGERPSVRRPRHQRYYDERAALGSMLKNFGVLTLLWALPLHFVVAIGRLILLALSRRFDEVLDLLEGWTWNLVHLPGTIHRRVRAQSVRAVSDRSLHRFMASPLLRLPRWLEQAERILEEQREEEREQAPFRRRATSLAAEHPALVAWVLGAGVTLLAYRSLVGPQELTGGALAAFPGTVGAFFAELVSGVRTTVLGGVQAASPSLGALGATSGVLFASPPLAQKVILAVLPVAAAVLLYRAALRQTGHRPAAVVAGTTYALSAVVLWSFSEGRLALLAALCAVPAIWDRLDASFTTQRSDRSRRAFVGLGMMLAIAVAFVPGIVWGLAVVLAVLLVFGRTRGRGLALAAAGALAGAVLLFPFVPELVLAPTAELGSRIGTTDMLGLAHLSIGSGPGSWLLSWFLPIGAVLSLATVGAEHRARAWRAAFVAVTCLFLAWASAAAYLPAWAANQPVYVVVMACAEALLIGYGLAALSSGIAREAFGLRQVLAGALVLVVGLGLTGQALAAAYGGWEIGPNRLPPAWSVISSSPGGPFRVLWLGRVDGDRFPAPGGDPQGTVEAGPASVRFSLTDRNGITALDTGRGEDGDGYAYVERVLTELLSGTSRHVGSLLGPVGVRFIVAGAADLPPLTLSRLAAQIDLDRIVARGLVIFSDAAVLPTAAVIDDPRFVRAARSVDLQEVASLPSSVSARPLHPVTGGWVEPSGDTSPATDERGIVYVADQYASAWRLRTDLREEVPEPAFGWAMSFPEPVGGFEISYSKQWIRTTELVVLLLLWLSALWVTRRPAG